MAGRSAKNWGYQKGQRYTYSYLKAMALDIENSLSSERQKPKVLGAEIPDVEKTGTVHECGTIAEIVAHYKSQQPPLHILQHISTRPHLEFVGPHYVVQKIYLAMVPFWDQYGESAFAHNNLIRQTLPEGEEYSELHSIGYTDEGALTRGKIIFEEKVGVVAKTKGRPLVQLDDPEFDWYLELLVSQVNGRTDGIYDARRVLKVEYFDWVAGGEFPSQWEMQQSRRTLPGAASKEKRNCWSSTVSDKKLRKILGENVYGE